MRKTKGKKQPRLWRELKLKRDETIFTSLFDTGIFCSAFFNLLACVYFDLCFSLLQANPVTTVTLIVTICMNAVFMQ